MPVKLGLLIPLACVFMKVEFFVVVEAATVIAVFKFWIWNNVPSMFYAFETWIMPC